jgi:hypothetical protein
MKALSVQQPWAWAIIYGGKDIENRDWYTPFRGRVLVHCGKKMSLGDVYYIEGNYGVTLPKDLPRGGIIGSVEIVDCVKQSKSKWFFGEYGFVLRNPIALPFTPYRGQLGFFEVSDGAAQPAEPVSKHYNNGLNFDAGALQNGGEL